MQKTTKELGAVLRQKRTNQVLSLRDLSEVLDIAKTLLQKYETGKRNISRKHFPIIVKYINGEYDEGIREAHLEVLRKKYAHLEGRKGLEFWDV
ncbi:helix-turn-helix domain-containing protein [Bacillus paranthracis]|uniref:helix-turn-helix domain-containing protein n=1 Tax=Bacillus paranthracis TaxID=2026186 RepID=UPI0021CFC8E3|nr:helix-turn-helix transcriptional regulator [Bacillus paranthracis]MCU5165935.1 helix-turn-helix domain-containing protein [Bacillus paranthracis]